MSILFKPIEFSIALSPQFSEFAFRVPDRHAHVFAFFCLLAIRFESLLPLADSLLEISFGVSPFDVAFSFSLLARLLRERLDLCPRFHLDGVV